MTESRMNQKIWSDRLREARRVDRVDIGLVIVAGITFAIGVIKAIIIIITIIRYR